MRTVLVLSVLALAGSVSMQAQPKPRETAKEAAGPFEVIHVRGNVYMFASDDGNVTVQVGEHRDIDGVLLVDSGPVQLADKLLAQIEKLTPKTIRYVINTSS